MFFPALGMKTASSLLRPVRCRPPAVSERGYLLDDLPSKPDLDNMRQGVVMQNGFDSYSDEFLAMTDDEPTPSQRITPTCPSQRITPTPSQRITPTCPSDALHPWRCVKLYIFFGGDPRTLGWLPKRPGSPLWRGGCRSSCWAGTREPWDGSQRGPAVPCGGGAAVARRHKCSMILALTRRHKCSGFRTYSQA